MRCMQSMMTSGRRLVGRFPDPGPLKYSKISSPDDSYQPLFTGPLGTNEMHAINDLSRPTASGPLGRQCSLDPMGPRAMLSLGDGNQPPSVGPVGRPWIPEQPGDQVTESTINGRLRQEVSRKVIPGHQIP